MKVEVQMEESKNRLVKMGEGEGEGEEEGGR